MRCGCGCLGSCFGCAPPRLAGVLGCVCLCACSPCTPPLLAGARSVGVCLGLVFGCAPILLAGLLGCVCGGLGAPLVPRHSWLGCAVPVWVFWLRFQPRPATPGWGVWCACVCLGWGFGCAPPSLAGVLGCVCLCACSPCTPPLLAGVCGVRVCVWVWVSAAPCHSWLGRWGVHVCVGAPPVPRHSWLGCAVWVGVFGLGFQLRHATPSWGVGLCVLVCVLPLCPANPGWGVRRRCACLGSGSGCARHSWLGCWGVCVLVCVLLMYPVTPGWGVRSWCMCSGSGLGCAPPLLAGVLGCVGAGVRAPIVPRHSWLGCAVWVGVFGLGFWLRPATPGWGVGVRGCRRACSLFTPPLLAGVCGVGWCVWPRVSDALRHSWLGCQGVRVGVCAPPVPRHSWLGCAVWVCMFGLGFGLRPATPGWGVGVCVCWCACSSRTPSILAWVCVLGVCARARVLAAPDHSWLGCWGAWVLACVPPFVPCHSWLGCAVLVGVFGLGFLLRPATPGWGVGVRGCWRACSPCTPSLLAGMCGMGVRV